MIHKLRRKLIAILMGVVTLILTVVFCTMVISTQRGIEESSMQMLRQAVGLQPEEEGPMADRPEEPPRYEKGPEKEREAFRLPIMVLELEGEGIAYVGQGFAYLSEAEIEGIAKEIEVLPAETGRLSAYDLRYMKRTTESGLRIALIDTSVETSILRDLVLHSLLIGGAALGAFFVVSILLARWAVRPIERAWEKQRQFVADASHELKTPLTVILSNAEMVAREVSGDRQNARRMENIQAEGLRMKRLIEEMLTLARSDADETKPTLSQVGLSDLVTESVLLFESALYEDGKHLGYEIEDGIEVDGEATQLRQLVDILLDNAGKYTARGGTIELLLRRTGRKMVELSVRNEGDPIVGEDLQRIFERFYRVDQAREHHGGFGLGLSIAQRIVAEHGGRIWAESDLERGNIFHVILPAKPEGAS